MATTVAAWAIFAFLAAPLAANAFSVSHPSRSADLLGGTLVPVIFIVLVFAFANSQRAIDRVFRVSDTD